MAADPPSYPIQTNYFAVTAVDDNGLESDFSNEAVSVLYSTNIGRVTLAWDPSPSSNIVNYVLYTGLESGAYTASNTCGTNLSFTASVLPAALTNRLVTVTTTGSQILFARTVSGPWIITNGVSLILTNPVAPLFFRSRGPATNRLTITATPF